MSDSKRPSLLKPTLDTPFHIDFDWWRQNDRDWKVYLRNMLCDDHQQAYADWQTGQQLDWIDPLTAEVRALDGVQHTLVAHCAKLDDFLTAQTAMVEAVFRLFLMTDNQPMSANQISQKLGRPALTILKTLAGPRIYRGIRPCCD